MDLDLSSWQHQTWEIETSHLASLFLKRLFWAGKNSLLEILKEGEEIQGKNLYDFLEAVVEQA